MTLRELWYEIESAKEGVLDWLTELFRIGYDGSWLDFTILQALGWLAFLIFWIWVIGTGLFNLITFVRKFATDKEYRKEMRGALWWTITWISIALSGIVIAIVME